MIRSFPGRMEEDFRHHILQAEGKTILLTSHNFEDLEALCQDIYVLEDGRLGTLPREEMHKRFRG